MARIQFIKGIDETQIPLISLTRSRQGTTGTATFIFDNPDVFTKIEKDTKITAMYLIHADYQFITKDIRANFLKGEPYVLKAVCIFTNKESWDSFVIFIESWAKENDLVFVPKFRL